MIGTTGATILAVILLLLAAALGIGGGGLACLVLRQPWHARVAVIDAAVAATVAFIAGNLVAAIEMARHNYESRVTLILAIAVGGVLVRHIVRALRRHSLR